MRIFMIGAGTRAMTVARTLHAADPSVSIPVLFDPDLPAEEQSSNPLTSVSRRAADLTDVADRDFDLVLIGSPTCFHLEQLEIVRGFGKPIFCEKPAVLNIQESLELARLDAAGSFASGLYFGFVLRHSELFRLAASLVREDRVLTLEANEYLHPEHGAYIARNWRRRAALGGTYLLDKAVHDFDLFNQLIGSRPALVSSFARQAHFGGGNQPRDPTPDGRYRALPSGWRGVDSPFDPSNEIHDVQVVSAEYESGALLTFNTNTHSGLLQRRMHIGTNRKSIELDFPRNELTWRSHHDGNESGTRRFEGGVLDHYGTDPRQAANILEFAKSGASASGVRQAIEAGLTVMLTDQAAQSRQVVDCRKTWTELDDIYASLGPATS